VNPLIHTLLDFFVAQNAVDDHINAVEKENPHQPLAKPMGAAANFWGEPCAHPSHGFSVANPMPRKSPHWYGARKPVRAKSQAGLQVGTLPRGTEVVNNITGVVSVNPKS